MYYEILFEFIFKILSVKISKDIPWLSNNMTNDYIFIFTWDHNSYYCLMNYWFLENFCWKKHIFSIFELPPHIYISILYCLMKEMFPI